MMTPEELKSLAVVAAMFAGDGSGPSYIDPSRVIPDLVEQVAVARAQGEQQRQEALRQRCFREKDGKLHQHQVNINKGNVHAIKKYQARVAELEAQVAELRAQPRIVSMTPFLQVDHEGFSGSFQAGPASMETQSHEPATITIQLNEVNPELVALMTGEPTTPRPPDDPEWPAWSTAPLGTAHSERVDRVQNYRWALREAKRAESLTEQLATAERRNRDLLARGADLEHTARDLAEAIVVADVRLAVPPPIMRAAKRIIDLLAK